MVKFQPSKLAMRVRFPLPAQLGMFSFVRALRLACVYEARLRFSALHGLVLQVRALFRVLDRIH